MRHFYDTLLLSAWTALLYMMLFALSAALLYSLMHVRLSWPLGISESGAHVIGACMFFVTVLGTQRLTYYYFRVWPRETWQHTTLLVLTFLLALAVAALCTSAFAGLAVSSFVRRSANLLILGAIPLSLSLQYLTIRMREPKPVSKPSISRSQGSQKVVLIGIDGADLRRIAPLIQQARLPNLQNLSQGGFTSPLRTSRPTLSLTCPQERVHSLS